MIGASKILTVSYGTFSCTLEGFDDPFNTMKAIAEYFRDLAAEDRYFGAEPPTPDAAMLHRIAEREIQRRVEAKIQDNGNGVILRAETQAEADAARPAPPVTLAAPMAQMPVQPPPVQTQSPAPTVAPVPVDADPHSVDTVAAKLSRLRSTMAQQAAEAAPVADVAAPSVSFALPGYAASDVPVFADQAYVEDEDTPSFDSTADLNPDAALSASPVEADQDPLEDAIDLAAYAEPDFSDDQNRPVLDLPAVDLPATEIFTAPLAEIAEPDADEAVVHSVLTGEPPVEDFADTEFAEEEDWSAPDLSATPKLDIVADVLPESIDGQTVDAPSDLRTEDALPEDAPDLASDDTATDDAMAASIQSAMAGGGDDDSDDAAPEDALIYDEALLAALADVGDDLPESRLAHDAEAPDDLPEAVDPWPLADEEDEAARAVTDDAFESALQAALDQDTDQPEQITSVGIKAADAALLSSLGGLEAARERADELPDDEAADDEPTDDLVDGDEAEALPEVAPAAIAEPVEAPAGPASQPTADNDDSARPDALDKLTRARARIIRIRRIEADAGPVATPEPAPAAAEIAPSSAPLSAEAEAELERELAALRGADEAATDGDAMQGAAGTSDPEPRQHFAPANEAADAAVSRLMAQADTQMEGAENKRRHSAIAHLKAAVAATVADRRANGDKPAGEPSRIARYRDDLAMVVRGIRPGAASAERPAPLVLVSEQRIDRSRSTAPTGPVPTAVPSAPAPSAPVRPRRVTNIASSLAMQAQADADRDDDDGDDDDMTGLFNDSGNFAEFAERLGVTELPDMLEAAAAYLACVEGRPQFTRPQLMRHVSTLMPPGEMPREDGLRSFGALLRTGKIEKIKRGQFALSESSHLLAQAKKIAG
ncbi:MAG: hypothetical protein V4747_01660 [Pseudomonadota bacterium]